MLKLLRLHTLYFASVCNYLFIKVSRDFDILSRELAQLSGSLALTMNVLVIPFSDSLKISHETTDKEEGISSY